MRVAGIKLYWTKDWRPDPDGIVTGAQASKASEIDRLWAEQAKDRHDLTIKLPETIWPTLDDTEKEWRIFHELLHFAPAKDANGEQKRDSKDRLLWRTRRHPITAFPEEIDRYGIERVIGRTDAMRAAIDKAEMPLFAGQKDGEATGENAKGNGTPANLDASPIEALQLHSEKISDRHIQLLENAGFDRVGKLARHMDQAGTWWTRDIAGIGPETGQPIADAVAAFRAGKKVAE